MRLLEYAEVVIGNGHWMKGWEAEDRMHGLSVQVFDPCDVTETPVISRTGAVSEVQRVAITGSPTSGWFQLRLDGGVTGQIAYNATAATVATALGAITSRSFTVTGGPGPGTPWTVTFSDGGDVPQMTTTASLPGGTVTVTTTTAGATGGTSLYRVGAFGIKADLPRSLMCGQADDEEWLRKAVKEAAEQGVGLAATFEHADGTETWIGDNDVIAGPATLDAANAATARQLWLSHNVGVPAFHLSDKSMVKAVTERIVQPVGDQFVTIWGDPVVNSPGYPDDTAFLTGPLAVYLSSIDADTLFKHTTNESRVIANMIAALDMPPGQVVRIGAVPA